MHSSTLTTAALGSAPTPKSQWRHFALFGGEPAFPEPLHVGSPNLPDEAGYLERVAAILRSRRLTNDGPVVRQFEEAVAQRLGVRHAIAVNNATTGLQLLFHALELKGDIIMPSFTFVATAHAARWIGLRPRFADIEADTCQVSADSIQGVLRHGRAAILGVHLWGGAADVSSLTELSSATRTPLLFDASHAFGCDWEGVGLARFGVASVISLHATKVMHSIEGGVVCTQDDDLASRLKTMRNFGFSTYDTVESLGTNAKMHEISAAMGLEMLIRLDAIIEHNRRVFEVYERRLTTLPGIRIVRPRSNVGSNFQYVPVLVDAHRAGISRDRLLQLLWAENVRARRYFFPGCHRMAPYDCEPDATLVPLPHTELACAQALTLPTGTSVSAEMALRIAEMIAFACENAGSMPRPSLAAA